MPLLQLPDGKTINLPDNMSDEQKRIIKNELAQTYPDHFTPEYERTIGGHALELAKGIPAGFLSGLVSAGEGIVNIFDVGNDSALGEGLRGLQRDIEESPLGPEEAYRDAYSTMLGKGLGSFATFMTPGAIARGVGLAGKTAAQIPALKGISNVRGLGTTLTTGRARSIEELGALSLAVPMGISEQGQRLEQARMRGEEVGAGKEFLAELAGAGIGMSELLPIERAWRRFGKVNMGRFDLGEATKQALMQAGVEGAQEAGAGIMQNLTAKNLYDPDLPITDSAMDEASVGGGVGFISSFLMTAFGARRFAKNRMDEVDRREQLKDADSKPIASTPEDLNPTTSTALVPIEHYDTLQNIITKQSAASSKAEDEIKRDQLAIELSTYNPYFEVVQTPDGFDIVNTRTNEVQSSTPDINEAFVAKQQLNKASNDLRTDKAVQDLTRINGLVGSGAVESMARNILNPETSQIPKQVLANYDSRITDEMVKEARILLGEIKGKGGKAPARTLDTDSTRASGAVQVWRKNLKRRKIQEKDFYTVTEAKRLLKPKDFNDLLNDIADGSKRQYDKYVIAAQDTVGVQEKLPPIIEGERSWNIPTKITLKTFNDLAVNKNIRLDVNSKAFQHFLETYTGERSFSKLSKSQKRMAYAKFSRIPSLAKGVVGKEIPPVPFPDFSPRPYTFEQYNTVYKNSLESPNQIVSPKSIMDSTGLDRESATKMFEDFVESGRLAPQEKITTQIEYFTPQGRSFNRRGAPYKEPQLRVIRKQTYKGKWIPRDIAELESEYVYDLTATKGESVEDYAQRLTNMGIAPEVINDLVEAETSRQAEIEASKGRIISPAGKDITETVAEEKEIVAQAKERNKRFEKEVKKVAKRLNIPDRVTIKLVNRINKERDQGTWEATKKDYRDPAGKVLISVTDAMFDGDGNPVSEEEAVINMARTLHHEGIHAFRDLDLFTDREWNILKKYTERVRVPESVSKQAFDNGDSFNDLAKRTYSDLDIDSQNEEAVAMLFEYWSQNKSIATGKPRNIFERIANFIRSIVYSSNVAGFRSPIDILQDIEAGVIGARPVGEVRSLRELDRAAALGIDLQAVQAEEVDKELDVGATLDAATARASYGSAPAVTAIVHNNKIIAIGRKREMLKQMKQLRRETGDDRKRLHLASAPGRKVGDLWDTKPVPRASRRLDNLREDFIENENLVRSSIGSYRDNPIDANAEAGVIRDEKTETSEENRRGAERTRDGGPSDIIRTRTGRTLDETNAIETKADSFVRSRENNNAFRLANQYNKDKGQSPYQRVSEQTKPELQTRISDAYFNLANSIKERVNSLRGSKSKVSSENPPTRYEVNQALSNPTQREIEIYEGFRNAYPNMVEKHQIESYRDLVMKSYNQLAIETQEQYDYLLDNGMIFEYHDGAADYANSKEMLSDAHLFNHLWVFKGGESHPFLAELSEKGLSLNDKFRGVHDYFGHAVNGNGFGKVGEENAFVSHSQMYSPLAAIAMASETRGQNSYVNYSGINASLEPLQIEAAKARQAYKETGDERFIEYADSLGEEIGRNFQYADQMSLVLDSELISDIIPDSDLIVTRASRRIKDAPTLTEEQQQELYTKAENSVKSTSRGAIPLWNLNADPYATAVGYKYAEENNVKDFGKGKSIEEVIDESMDDPIVTRASRRIDEAQWESEYEILKDVSYGKEKPKQSVADNQKLTAFQSILKNIFPNTNIDQAFERFRNKFIYQHQSVARTEKQSQEKTGIKYEADASATSWMAFADRSRGMMAKILTTGGIELRETTNGAQAKVLDNVDFRTMDGQKIEGGLIAVIARLHSYGRQAKIPIEDYAKAYSIVQRAIRLKSEGIATPVTDEMITKANQMVEQYPIIKEFYDNYQKFNKNLIDFAIATGTLDEELGKLWQEQSDYYPFYRHFEEDDKYDGPSIGNRMLGKSPFEVELEGSSAPVNVDMLEAITRNSMALLNRSMRNQALKYVTRDAVDAGNAVKLKEKPKKMGKDVIWYQDGGKGKEVWFRVNDPLLLESLLGFGVSPYRGIEQGLAMPAGLLRDMITRSPDFVIVNMMRDTLSAYVTSGAEMTPVVDTAKNFFTSSGNKVLEELERMAVIGGYDFSNDPKDVAKFINKEIDKLEKGLTIKSGMRAIWDGLGQMTTKSDAATRIGVYQDVYKKTYNRKIGEGVSEQEAEIVAESEASYQALEVINFSRRGNSPMFKVYTAAVPFLNARIQGLDVLYRSASGQYASDRLTLKPAEIQQNMLLRLGSLGLLTMLYYAMVSDTDEYKNARREVRDDNWIIPVADDFAIKIPIPFEVGVIAKVFPERIMDALMGESTIADVTSSMNRQLATSLAFPALPIGGQFEPSMGIQAIAPLVDAIMNHDSYTKKDIVPFYMEEGLEKGYQSQYTTNELARVVGEFFNVSPIKIQYVMQGYGGSLGSYALSAVDAITRSVTDRDFIPPSADRMPMMRRFVQTSRGGGLQQQFYELRGEVNEVVQTLNLLKKQGRTNEYIAYRDTHSDILNTKKAVLAIDRYMKNWRTKRDKITMSKTISPTVKAQLLKQLDNERDRRLSAVPVIRSKANVPFMDIAL
tara:strand:- start:5561 stop:13294 length:7734 start_codon:yes stop_codon:yes gene_type:complete